MASSAKHLSLLFLLTLLSSPHVYARDSQFFNKIPTNTNNNVPTKDKPLNKQLEQEQPLNKQLEQEPSFMPQTLTGYGLYSRESGQLPPTTTTTNNAPYTTTTNLPYNTESEEESFNNGLPENYNTVAYVTKPQGYTTTTTKSNNYYSNGYNTVQKQGMSDTRFLENGKYFYSPNVPNREKYNSNAYENSRGFGARDDEYNNKGYYGNNGNSYENNFNSMEGYQNQEEYGQESQDEFMP